MAISESSAQVDSYYKPDTAQLLLAHQTEHKAGMANDSMMLAQAWCLYGEAYEVSGDNHTAEQYFLRALRTAESRRVSEQLIRLYVRLSEVALRQDHFPKSLNYATLALESAQRIRSINGLIAAYRVLGHVRHFMWDRQGNRASYDSALFCFRQSERLSIQVRDTLQIIEANAFLGAFFTETNDPRVIPCLQKALDLSTHINQNAWRVKSLIHLATFYLHTNKLPLAWQALQQADTIYANRRVREYGVRAMLASRYVTYYQKTGQWQKAFGQFELVKEIESQQIMADRNGVVARLQIEYETQKKEASLINQQRLTTVATCLLILVIGVCFVLWRLYHKNRRISHQNEELVKEQNHRVKNNLQVVSSLLGMQLNQLTDDSARQAIAESQLRVQAMAILHRRLYDGQQLAHVNLKGFIPELVTSILKASGWTTAGTDFDIEPIQLSADKATPVGLIVNELVTNACKYAFPGNVNPLLRIRCHRNRRTITLEVADNGPGLDSAEPLIVLSDDLLDLQSRSFGMTVIKAQVAQLNGKGIFDTDSLGGGAVFTLTFNA